MGYRHQAINLKEPVDRTKLEFHLNTLRTVFFTYQSTTYWQPEGENWKKEVNHNQYNIYPVENNFGIAVSNGKKGNYSENRLFTVYPGLSLAILDWGLRYGYYSKVNGKRKGDRVSWAREKLERLGYKVAEKMSSIGYEGLKKKSRPFLIAAETSGIFKENSVIEELIKNLEKIVEARSVNSFIEVAVFSPAGDGSFNSPIGKSSVEHKYDFRVRPVHKKYVIKYQNRKIDENQIKKIFDSMKVTDTLGVCSNIPLEDRVTSDFGSHSQTPMVDFRCKSPEEAIHILERLKVPVKKEGVILLDSGNSFHAHLPNQILDYESTTRHLENLQSEEGVCVNWVPLQMDQTYQMLRVAPCIQKPNIPVILDL